MAFYFELMTTAIIAAFVPCVLWAMENGVGGGTRAFLKLCLAFSAVVVLSFALIMGVKLALLAHDCGSLQAAISYTVENIQRRTLGSCQIVPAIYFSPYGKVAAVLKCFREDYFVVPKVASVRCCVWLAFHGLCTLALLPRIRKYISPMTVRLIITQWCAFIALTSWWVLATPHAVIHCGYCSILQWIPFNFVAWATAVCLLRDLLCKNSPGK